MSLYQKFYASGKKFCKAKKIAGMNLMKQRKYRYILILQKMRILSWMICSKTL
jgi:hypothetical protein